MPLFTQLAYVKLLNTLGDYRYGYVSEIKCRGDVIVIDLTDEGVSKIAFDEEFCQNTGTNNAKDFNELLTEQEKKIIPLIGSMLNTKQIADKMGLSPVTIRAHIHTLKIKLQLTTREQLIVYSQGICKALALK